MEAIHLDSAYNGSNLTKDFALLELSSPVNSTVGEMGISAASNSAWEASVLGNIAYPWFWQNGARHTGGPNANRFRTWALALIDD